ncbi:MAG: membrane protein insertase YidC [Nitrospirae bacterium]|nr:membrane protein insertase YidC [Nitrospirota bacterium]
MEKRALIAVVLSVLVLVGYQYLFVNPKMKNMPRNVANQGREAQHNGINQAPPGELSREGGKGLSASSAPSVASVPSALPTGTQPGKPNELKTGEAKPVEEAVEKLVTVDTPFYTAVVSSRGAVFTSFMLKMYREKDGRDIILLKHDAGLSALALGSGTDFNISRYNFTTTASNLDLKKGQTATIVFELKQGAAAVKRTYTFSGDGYGIGLKDELSGLNGYYLTLGSDFNKESVSSYGEHLGPVVLKDMDRMEFKADKKLDTSKTLTGDIKWIANETKYFCEAIVPVGKSYAAKAVEGQKAAPGASPAQNPETPGVQSGEAIVWKDGANAIAAYKSSSAVNEFLIYIGPKKYELLKSLNVDLEHIVDFGFFSIISRPLFWILIFINRYVGNYGWSIIILTLVVRVPFIPLITKGQSSMKKLQKIQPLMTAIREQYKKDPQRMQKEIMVLYKKHKVNPMGGCLPILIQIPVFFALYKVLLVAIELRGASWAFWIKDLASKDPLYILPIIMGITMLIQQKMTPSTMDPAQAKIMMFMPIIFTFMFLNFPSGLVLYWLVSNVLSISQQFYVNKRPEIV